MPKFKSHLSIFGYILASSGTNESWNEWKAEEQPGTERLRMWNGVTEEQLGTERLRMWNGVIEIHRKVN